MKRLPQRTAFTAVAVYSLFVLTDLHIFHKRFFILIKAFVLPDLFMQGVARELGREEIFFKKGGRGQKYEYYWITSWRSQYVLTSNFVYLFLKSVK